MPYRIGHVGDSLGYLARRGEGGGGAYVRRGPTRKKSGTNDRLRERRLWEEAARKDARAGRAIGIQEEQLELNRQKGEREQQAAEAGLLMGAQQQQFNQGLQVAQHQLEQAQNARQVLDTLRDALEFSMTVDPEAGGTPFGDAFPPEEGAAAMEQLFRMGYGLLGQMQLGPGEAREFGELLVSSGMDPKTVAPPRALGEPVQARGRERPKAQPITGDNSAASEQAMQLVAKEGQLDIDYAAGRATSRRNGKTWVWDGQSWVPESGSPAQGRKGRGSRVVGDAALDDEVAAAAAVPR